MTARPQSRPLAGRMPPPPMAPPPVAVGPTPVMSVHPITRATGPSRSARVALAVSVLAAVSGVSFALGRLSVDGVSSGRTTTPFAASAFRANADSSAADVLAAALSSTSGTPSGPDRSASAAAATAADESDEDAATGVAATGEAATGEAAAGVATTGLAASGPGSAPAAGDGPPQSGGGAMAGSPGPGGGRGGLQGTVTEVTDATLTVALADGSTQTVSVDATTEWVQQQPITAADVSPGDTVSVQLPFGGLGGADEGTESVATQVTVTPAGS